MKFSVIIPARHASSRLPGKPLADIGGKPMVVRVAERAGESGAHVVLIATDHPGIAAGGGRRGFAAGANRAGGVEGSRGVCAVGAWLPVSSPRAPAFR